MLQDLTHELSTLVKAIEHKNLSAASSHVGISQPQLSRMIAKIEEELNVVLLDRSSRRNSGWTEIAHSLASAFSKGLMRLESEILAVAQERELHELRIGTLEGLSEIAMQFAQDCFKKLNIKTIHLDVLDFKLLDSQFLSSSLDLIFTVSPPNKQKFKNTLEVGFQQMEQIHSDKSTFICSSSELLSQKEAENEYKHLLVTNSLAIRQYWLKEIGGTGKLPIETQKGRGKGFYSVYLIGSELLNNKIWNHIVEIADA
jgi:DNA-binding transcriptional LysR family regulator